MLRQGPDHGAPPHAGPSRSKVPRAATIARIYMKLHRLCSLSALALTVFVSAGTALADPKGLWLAQDGARAKVGPCGGALCATIAPPTSALDPHTGRPC